MREWLGDLVALGMMAGSIWLVVLWGAVFGIVSV
jgi:hypothetical protein